MKTNNLIITILFLLLSEAMIAQSKTNIHYSIGFPMGDTKDYISKTSWRGVLFEYEKEITPYIGVGIQSGWNTFYEALARATYPLTNGAITSKQYRYINSVPIHVTGKYYFKDEESIIRPFVGLGLGTNYIEQRTDNGLFSDKDDAWVFTFVPKAGFLIPINFKSSATVSVDYNSTSKGGGVPKQSWLGLNIGISWDY